jgi:uncharacterized membrane protein
MTRTVRAEALFASDLQPSDLPTAAAVAAAVHATLRNRGGATGCAAAVAAEYGDHPETAPARMRWALALVDSAVPADLVAA